MSATTPPLAERVLAVLSEERPGSLVAPLSADRCEREPSDGSQPSARESDMRCWGLAYGLAFGILESEAPADIDREQLADEALFAARAAFKIWSTEIAPRPVVSSAVDAVLLAFGDAANDLDSVAYAAKKVDRPALLALSESLTELGSDGGRAGARGGAGMTITIPAKVVPHARDGALYLLGLACNDIGDQTDCAVPELEVRCSGSTCCGASWTR